MFQSVRCVLVLVSIVSGLSGCSVKNVAIRPAGTSVPLFTDLGSHHFKITTSSDLAQRYFNQGMTWAYAFNHDEAIRSFHQVEKLDPGCPMAWWGIALCYGPHINNSKMRPEDSEAAWQALQMAIKNSHRASPLEKKLIAALSQRYGFPFPKDRKPLDKAYADAMQVLWRKQPENDDVATLYAEALMDLRPWDLWTHDGQPQPGTHHILEVLEGVLARSPDHPGANHLYIHAVEPSPQFERGLAPAERLRDLVPAAGHLVHMPTHIDVLVGNWEGAVEQSERAIQADRNYLPFAPEPGFYARYMAHNHHMLAFACMMTGQSKRALQAARELVAGVPEELARTCPGVIDSKMPMVYEVLMRFGRWDDILSEPSPPEYLPMSCAIWRFARAVAYAAKKELADAERERKEFLNIAATISDDAKFENALASEVFSVADNVLQGEFAFHRGDFDKAIDRLRAAVQLEDRLTYDEPPVWVQPVRHPLGAVLVIAERYLEAEQVYREDLGNWPDNVWSLRGLAHCLTKRGATDEARKVMARLKKVGADADTDIAASCLCALNR